tara:strand:- start:8250 stop:10688 length:2439 start_codon:yes stop_codon:yes gene_type:complete
MAAITQLIPSYLGGVSTQPDVKKLPGQVREALNCFADPTFGMTKRSGSAFLANLTDAPELDNGKWFFILRDNREAYIGCIVSGNIRIWNAITRVEATVDTSAGSAYIQNTGSTPDRLLFDVLTVQDTSIITNKGTIVAEQPAPAYSSGQKATIRLLEVSYGANYRVSINGGLVASYDSPDNAEEGTINANTILDALVTGLNSVSGLSALKLDSSIEISKTAPFTIDSSGGLTNDGLISFQDDIDVAVRLPNQSVANRIVQIINIDTDGSGYWTRFVADNGVSGNGVWEESIDPSISPGLDLSTMPHQLRAISENVFDFRPIPFEDRLVGDNTSNPQPSFVGFPIQAAFFNSNRLGFLSEANVILSRSGSFFNFYGSSAQIQVDSDVIDLSASSTRPVLLFSALNVAQGLLMFSRRQQFLLASDDGGLSPTSAIVTQLSEYEMDVQVPPASQGAAVAFTSRSPGQSRIYSMVTRGFNETPSVTDIGKVVSGYLPQQIDTLGTSPQNELTVLSSVNSNELYFYRTYSNGDQILIQSWFKWRMPGEMQTFFIVEDRLFTVCKAGGKYVLSISYFNQVQEAEIVTNSDGNIIGNPCLDFYSNPLDVSFDGQNTKCYLPILLDNKEVSFLVTDERDTLFRRTNLTEYGYSNTSYGDPQDDAGYFVTTTEYGTDANGSYALFRNTDLTEYSNHCVIGYNYEMSLDLPKIFFKRDEKISDYTASMTISRLKFSVGLSGGITFKLKARGTEEWSNTIPVPLANYYLADDAPISDESIFILPIYQKTDNFLVKLTSKFPFPVSVNSMMWEGQYSPRYYKRI